MTFSSPLCTAPDGGSCPHLHFTGHRFWDLLTLAMQPTPNDILNLLIFPPPPPSYLPEKHHGKLDDVSTLSSPRPGVWERPRQNTGRGQQVRLISPGLTGLGLLRLVLCNSGTSRVVCAPGVRQKPVPKALTATSCITNGTRLLFKGLCVQTC